FGLLLKEKTIEFARVTWMAVPITTIAFVLLIPPLGAAGAVLAVAVGNLFRLAYVHRRAIAVYDMQLEWSRVLPIAGIFVIGVTALRLTPIATSGLAADAAVLIAGALLLWSIPLTVEDRRRVLEFARTVTRRLPALGAR